MMLKDKTVLIVDDDDGYREILCDEFEYAGAKVHSAENGMKAFEIVKSQKIDAVVSDIRMPGGSGVYLLDQIKKSYPETPIVMLISAFSDLSTEDAYNKGADALFSKPCDLSQLIQAVHLSLKPKNERLVRKFERLASDFKVEITSTSLKEAIETQVLSLGRGGMFVAGQWESLNIGSRVSYQLMSNNKVKQIFEGIGVCRWIRKEPEMGLVPGIGIEFSDLSQESLKSLENILIQLRPRAFIPKGTDGD
ncbi:MAG: response regulator [Pseudomonadota bacterium]|nr:response regulator [Pseudomonadota bacterium]